MGGVDAPSGDSVPTPTVLDFVSEGATTNADPDPMLGSEGASTSPSSAVPVPPTTTAALRRSGRSRRPNPKVFGPDWQTNAAVSNTFLSRLNTQRIRAKSLNNQFLNSLRWDSFQGASYAQRAMSAFASLNTDYRTGLLEWLHPMTLGAKANSSDTPRWDEAMSGPHRDGYWEACKIELETLEEKKNSWDVVPRQDWMNVLPSTWAFRCKRYPDGSVKKLKARFCVRGDRQVEGIDYFETFAPVVSWITVRLLLALSLVLGLVTRQVDYTAAFLHADIDKDPNWDGLSDKERAQSGVYVEMPRGFGQPGKVLKLKKSLYGLKQSPRNFFLHLKGKLEATGFHQSDADACLFISDRVICLVYVDDTLFFSPRQSFIDDEKRTRCHPRRPDI